MESPIDWENYPMTMQKTAEHGMHAHSDHQGNGDPQYRSRDASTASGERPASASALLERLHQADANCKRLIEALAEAAAEQAYARRRAEIDPGLAGVAAVEEFASTILPLKDVLETALRIRTSDAAAFREGLALALRKLTAELAKHGLHEIAPSAGDAYDPVLHQADGLPGQGRPDCRIAAIHEKGYLLNGRTLRPAHVSIYRSGPKTG
jgi:molecular chaperone GrpE